MPIKSKSQWKYLAINHPELLHKWQKEAPREYKNLPEKTASVISGFCDEMEKLAISPVVLDLAGLTTLALPSVNKIITGRRMSERKEGLADLAGLGMLAGAVGLHARDAYKAKKAARAAKLGIGSKLKNMLGKGLSMFRSVK